MLLRRRRRRRCVHADVAVVGLVVRGGRGGLLLLLGVVQRVPEAGDAAAQRSEAVLQVGGLAAGSRIWKRKDIG